MKVNASCHCGRITYEAEVDPDKAAICHCADCQTLSGTAYRTVVPVPDNQFTLLSGTPKVYVKTAASGNKREQAFCGDCGSPIYATSAGDGPKILGLRVGAMRQRNELVPRKQIWAQSAVPWLSKMGSIPKLDGQ